MTSTTATRVGQANAADLIPTATYAVLLRKTVRSRTARQVAFTDGTSAAKMLDASIAPELLTFVLVDQ